MPRRRLASAVAALALAAAAGAGVARAQVQDIGQSAEYLTVEFRALEQVAISVASMIEVLGPDLRPSHLAEIVSRNVKEDTLIYGSAIAFLPGTFDFVAHDIGEGVVDAEGNANTLKTFLDIGGTNYSIYCPYAYRGAGFRENPDREPYTFDLADGYDYTANGTEWFLDPFEPYLEGDTAKAVAGYWTRPYFDEGAGNINMVTFSVPFFAPHINVTHLAGAGPHLARLAETGDRGFPWGIATIDIPIGDLKNWVEYELAGWVLGVTAGLAAVVTACNAAFAWINFRYRTSSLIRASSPPFNYTILFASTAAAWSALTFVLPVGEDGVMCHLRLWLVSLSVMTMFAALFVKTYRIARIFRSGVKGTRKVTNADLFRGLGMLLSVQVLVLTAATAIPSQRTEYRLEQNESISTGGTFYEVAQCSVSTGGVLLTFAIFAALSVWGVVLAFRVRKLPSAFNEGSHIATALGFVVVMGILVVPVQFLVDDNPQALALLRAVGLVLTCGVTTVVLFAPKVLAIAEGRENERVETTSVVTAVGANKSPVASRTRKPGQQHSISVTGNSRRGAPSSATATPPAAAAAAAAPSLHLQLDPNAGQGPSSAPGSPVPAGRAAAGETEMATV